MKNIIMYNNKIWNNIYQRKFLIAGYFLQIWLFVSVKGQIIQTS